MVENWKVRKFLGGIKFGLMGSDESTVISDYQMYNRFIFTVY